MRFTFNVPQPIDRSGILISAIRMLGGLSIFGFFSFAAIDPMVTSVYHTGFLWVRGVSIAILAGLVSLSWKALSERQLLWVGAIICTLTGVVVTLLTQMAGGPASHYWTMLMLLFFGTVTLLPAPTKWSTVIISLNIAFYILWMTVWDSWGGQANVAISIAGLLLSFVVCIWSSLFLNKVRLETFAYQKELQTVNRQLQAEIEVRQRAQEAQKQAQAQFLQAQKLEAIGHFVAGMAHEVNNVLTGVSVGAEAAKIHRHNIESHNTQLNHIHRAVERGKNLTRDLLSFARKSPRVFETISVSAQVEQLIDMIQRTHRGRIAIRSDLFDEALYINGDASLLFQAMLNICLNGIDAMDGSGELRIRLFLQEKYKICIEIEDHGCGMTESDKDRIFEPFFTTKPVGQGTGLGLAMAYGVIAEHGGLIRVETGLGVGTRFEIQLPAVEEKVDISRLDDVVGPFNRDQSGKILVIDDDELVRELTVELLKEVGFSVMSANSGQDGLALYRLHQPYSVVIVDMIMPEMRGDAVFKQIRAHNPNQPVIFVSGYTDDNVVDGLKDMNGWQYVQKPFTAQQLFNAIGEMADVKRIQGMS